MRRRLVIRADEFQQSFARPGLLTRSTQQRPGCPLALIPDGGEEIVRWRNCCNRAADWRGMRFLSPSEGERIKEGGWLLSACSQLPVHDGSSGKMCFGSKASFRRRMSFTGRSALGAFEASRW